MIRQTRAQRAQRQKLVDLVLQAVPQILSMDQSACRQNSINRPTLRPDDVDYWLRNRAELEVSITDLLCGRGDPEADWENIMRNTAWDDQERILFYRDATVVNIPDLPALNAKDFRTSEENGIKIRWIGGRYTRAVFLNGSGKAEEAMPATKLRIHRLRREAGDYRTIDALGGDDGVETTLGQLRELIWQSCRRGDDEILWCGSLGNIFYIRDQEGVLRRVHCFHSGKVWYLDDCRISNEPHDDNTKFISR